MRVVLWCCRIFIFLFLLAFALKNTAPVSVSFFFETSWQAPLIIVVLAFFAAGMALGVLALALAPFILLLSVWIYMLVFAFAALWFAHFLLPLLSTLRAEASLPEPLMPLPAAGETS